MKILKFLCFITAVSQRPTPVDTVVMVITAQLRATIRKHINIHSDVKAYKCSECGKGFNFRQKVCAIFVASCNSGPSVC